MDSTIVVAAITTAGGLLTGILGTDQYHRRRNGNSKAKPPSLDMCKAHGSDIESLKKITSEHKTSIAVQGVQLTGMIKLFDEKFKQVNEGIDFIKRRLSG